MQYDGVGFNDDIPKRMKREEFVKHEMHANHYKQLKAEEKEKVLGEIYDLMVKGAEAETESGEVKSDEPGGDPDEQD